jgi:hypothetical protein
MEKSTFILGILFLLFALNLSSSNARPWKQLVRVKRSSVVKPIEAKVVQETKKVDAGILKLVKRDSAEKGIFGDFDGAKVDEIREQLDAEERGTKNVEKPLEIEKAAEILVDTAIDAEKSIRDEDDDDDDVNSQSELEEVEAEEDKALMELENEIIEEEEEEEAEEEAAEEEMEAEEEKQAEAEVEEEEEEKEKEEEVGIDDEDEDDDDDEEFKELLDDFDFDSQFDVASDDGGLLDDPLDGSSDADDEADGQSFWSYMMDAFHLGPGKLAHYNTLITIVTRLVTSILK